jgi:hypothetical protein
MVASATVAHNNVRLIARSKIAFFTIRNSEGPYLDIV